MKLIIFLLSLLFCQATGFSTSGRRNTRNSIGCAFSANVQSSIQTSTESRDISLQLQNDSDASDVDRVTIKQKIEVCLYRFTLTSSSVAYATGQLSKLLLVSGSGLSTQTIAAIEQNCHAILGWGVLFASLLAPAYLGAVTDQKKENDVDNALFLLLNELLPTLASFAIVVEIINTIQNNLSQGTANFLSATSDSLDSTTDLFICAICLREIGFFGASYKAEAILAIVFSVALTLNDSIGFSESALTAGSALCLLVLSFGKFFEPIEDDLRPNYSAFFKDER
jgi:hypothetical protein